MFLKRIEMQGFKSFADRVTISFEHPVTGVVGPNGCGKSNIVDAIRWVLGEQSVKSLRGSAMSDVIFSGSENRRRVNMAEVTLVFDNSQRVFDVGFEEVEITRRLHREDGSSEYYINKTPCRLRDIMNLTMDSGIGRDSLSLISQGTISHFSEAKPHERRGIFEEAAGVSKYRKRKDEALSKLDKTQQNLDRIFDIYHELEKQVFPLRKAAEKAKIYQAKKERLQEIEISVIKHQITHLKLESEEANSLLDDNQAQQAILQAGIQVHENSILLTKNEMNELEREIAGLQESVIRTVDEIKTLETRKIEIDERRKYTLEVGNPEEKRTELKALLEEAKKEYEDRSLRLNQLNEDIRQIHASMLEMNRRMIDQNSLTDEKQSRLNRLMNQLEVATSLESRPYMSQMGVQSVMNARQSLNGVHGVVSALLTAHSDYEEAIAVALGGAMYHIVTQDEASARQAINFLKRNESGRATFLPLTVLRSRTVSREHRVIAENSSGYRGTASEFVSCDSRFSLVNESLLGNVLVVDNLENGNHLAKLLNYQYKLVSLDGEVIHRGGSMTGGRQKDNNSPISIKKEINQLKERIDNLQTELKQEESKRFDLSVAKSELESELIEKRISAAQLEPVVETKRAKFERLKSDLDQIAPHLSESSASFEDELVDALNKAYYKRDSESSQLNAKQEQRQKYAADAERREHQLRLQRKELSQCQLKSRDLELQLVRQSTQIENLIQRLNQDYQMTYEYAMSLPETEVGENALEEVNQLRHELESLGHINMTAPQEYEVVNERYEQLKAQFEEISESKQKIVDLISDLNQIMTVQFKETLDRINEELPSIIQAMFGGGKAYLSLEDPEDLLGSGIEVNVQPPGKAIKNMRLFSGGEKSLIAISVLFAILKVRHVPLCVFDEVEAALDQANVERFAAYMKRFSESTQFIVLTHRPGTMAQADILFGVTMAQQGVSQMLKVRLHDAMMMAETEASA